MKRYLIILFFFGSCGKSNLSDCENSSIGACSELTEEEKAHQDLDAGRYSDAITKLWPLIDANPTEYRLRTLIAAAYAAHSGFNLLDSVKDQLSAGESDSKDVFKTIDRFVPSPKNLTEADYDERIARMKAAIVALEAIPEDKRKITGTEKYARSAALQLGLYLSAYSAMLVNKFLYSNGAIDVAKLATMTLEDAILIVKSLAGAAAAISGQDNAKISKSIDKTINGINEQTGSDEKEKLARYVAQSQ